MEIGTEDFIETDHHELRYCYSGFCYHNDVVKLGRCKTRIRDFDTLDLAKRNILLNDMIIVKNVFDPECILINILKDLDETSWPIVVTILYNISQIRTNTVCINNVNIDIACLRNDSLLLEFTND